MCPYFFVILVCVPWCCCIYCALKSNFNRSESVTSVTSWWQKQNWPCVFSLPHWPPGGDIFNPNTKGVSFDVLLSRMSPILNSLTNEIIFTNRYVHNFPAEGSLTVYILNFSIHKGRPCLWSGGQPSVFEHESPSSNPYQATWVLWCTKCHWDMFFFKDFKFSSVSAVSLSLQNFIYLPPTMHKFSYPKHR